MVEWTTIRVTTDTRDKINDLKGPKSYDDYLMALMVELNEDPLDEQGGITLIDVAAKEDRIISLLQDAPVSGPPI